MEKAENRSMDFIDLTGKISLKKLAAVLKRPAFCGH